jgi:hypothetical protein
MKFDELSNNIIGPIVNIYEVGSYFYRITNEDGLVKSQEIPLPCLRSRLAGVGGDKGEGDN